MNRLSKLNNATVKHMIRSNPYNKAAPSETEVLAAAVRLSMSGIQRLDEECGYWSSEIQACVRSLKDSAESLQSILSVSKPVIEKANGMVLEKAKDDSPEIEPSAIPTATRPWANQRPFKGKKHKTRR